MNGLMAWMEKYILPTAAKKSTETSGGTKGMLYCITCDNGWINAVMINAIIRDLPKSLSQLMRQVWKQTKVFLQY